MTTTPSPLDGLGVIEVMTMAHVYGWGLHEIHEVNVQDREMRALVENGTLVPVNEETRKLLPEPRKAGGPAGCGCGK